MHKEREDRVNEAPARIAARHSVYIRDFPLTTDAKRAVSAFRPLAPKISHESPKEDRPKTHDCVCRATTVCISTTTYTQNMQLFVLLIYYQCSDQICVPIYFIELERNHNPIGMP